MVLRTLFCSLQNVRRAICTRSLTNKFVASLHSIIWTAEENEITCVDEIRKCGWNLHFVQMKSEDEPRVEWNLPMNPTKSDFIASDFIHLWWIYSAKGRFHCSSVLRDKNKNPPRKVGFELCQRHNVFISWSFGNAVWYAPCELPLLRGGATHSVLLFAKHSRSNLHLLADKQACRLALFDYREYREYANIKCCTKFAPKSHQHSTLFCSINWNWLTCLQIWQLCHKQSLQQLPA